MDTPDGGRLRFDVYGRAVIEVERRDGRWVASYVGEGRRRPAEDVRLPPEAPAESLADHLDVLFHEYARPGTSVRRVGWHAADSAADSSTDSGPTGA